MTNVKATKVITFGGIKGGPGKTTIALNTAIQLHHWGHSVLVIDSDHQRSASQWSERRAQHFNGKIGYIIMQLLGARFFEQINELRGKYDYIIIDCHGGDNAEHREALAIADIIMVPVKPRALDVWTIADVEALVMRIKTLQPQREIEAYSFLNQADLSSQENRETAKYLSEFEAIQFIDTPVTNRKAFARSGAFGMGIMEYMQEKDETAYVDLNAVKEFEALLKTVLAKSQIIA